MECNHKKTCILYTCSVLSHNFRWVTMWLPHWWTATHICTDTHTYTETSNTYSMCTNVGNMFTLSWHVCFATTSSRIHKPVQQKSSTVSKCACGYTNKLYLTHLLKIYSQCCRPLQLLLLQFKFNSSKTKVLTLADTCTVSWSMFE